MIRFFLMLFIAVVLLLSACTKPTEDSPSHRVRHFAQSYFLRKWDDALIYSIDAAHAKIVYESSFVQQLQDTYKEATLPELMFYVKDSIFDSSGAMIYTIALFDHDATGGFQESLFRITLKSDSGCKISNYQFIRSDHDFR